MVHGLEEIYIRPNFLKAFQVLGIRPPEGGEVALADDVDYTVVVSNPNDEALENVSLSSVDMLESWRMFSTCKLSLLKQRPQDRQSTSSSASCAEYL